MKVFPILDPVSGEQLLSVEPAIEAYPDVQWRQRLNYFTGRALTHTALRTEQQGRAGHLATLGQALSPGAVTGLAAVAAPSPRGVVIEISAGLGLAASGEVVTLNRNHQVFLDDIQVYAPAWVLDSEASSSATGGAYKLGDSLAELRAAGRPLSQALVLVLQPVAVEHFGQEPSTDPCDYDPGDEAFENWQWLDGCRLALYAWPAELGPLPAPGAWRRNRIAHAIFNHERNLSAGEHLPWTHLGVPVALVGLKASLSFDFLDSHSVVRRGGEARGGALPISPAGNRFVWQAQFEQFNEQLVDWLMTETSLAPEMMRAEQTFRHLPPVGVLPKEVMNPRQQQQRFFPVSYKVEAMAIPYEQLDLAIQETASLAPFDLNTPDRLEMLVPVPQEHYEPELLVVEQISPEFGQAITEFSNRRARWLGRRLDVRSKASVTYQAIKGEPLPFPVDDPNAIDSLEQAADFEQVLVTEGDNCRYLKGQSAPPSLWYRNDFDDTDWDSGLTAIGYGSSNVATSLADMKDNYFTVFLRHRFSLGEVEEAHRYTLTVTTRGGFYAYLNGHYLDSANVSQPAYNAPATQVLDLDTRRYELGELQGRLLAGENVLAIQAHNGDITSANFIISVDLLDTEDNYGTVLRFDKQSQPHTEVTLFGKLRNYLDTSTPLSDTEVSKLDELGVEEYIDFLQKKINKADDRVEFGFLRMRTDIYRVRQMMLGNDAGTKLATSPALAEIAKGDSAVATKQELSNYYTRLKQASKTAGGGLDGEIPAGEGGSSAPPDMQAMPVMMRYIPPAGADIYVSGEMAGRAAGGVSGLKSGAGDGVDVTGAAGGKAGNIAMEIAAIQGFGSRSLENSSAELLKAVSAADIGEQNPLVGNVQFFNNATVGERLEESSANISHMAGVAAKGELISELLDTDINLADLRVPGVRDEGEESNKTFADINSAVMTNIIGGFYDSAGGDDEAAYFNAGVKALENVVGILRLVEGRVHAYRRALARCKSTLKDLKTSLQLTDQRLKTIGDELAEARHDVSVARALEMEEQARLDALNARRDKVLETLVPFLVFRRPRLLDPRHDLPVHYLNPDLSQQPLPLCDLSEVEAPEALEAMMDVVRDAPLKWFEVADEVLPKLSRPADLHVTLAGAKKRALGRINMHPFFKLNFDVPDKLFQGIGMVLQQSQQRMQLERKQTAAINVASFQRFGWREAVQKVRKVVSLGDVIDGNHGRMGASHRAARELADITEVVTCLYLRFSAISPGIRLDWAERLSQFDAAVSLRNLYTLPRFGELDYMDRHSMQALADWLYGRVVDKYSEAESLMSDLIRVALLLASQSPVNQLIAGHVAEPVRVQLGSRIRIAADLSRVRIGMAVSMNSAGNTVARGKVADITGGQVMAEISTMVSTSVDLAAGSKVQIGERLGMTLNLLR